MDNGTPEERFERVFSKLKESLFPLVDSEKLADLSLALVAMGQSSATLMPKDTYKVGVGCSNCPPFTGCLASGSGATFEIPKGVTKENFLRENSIVLTCRYCGCNIKIGKEDN